jgi:ribonuclease Z
MLFSKYKNGKDVTLDDGRVIDNVELTFDPKPPMRYAFVQTQPIMRLLFLINGVDVLYHESTFYNQKKF